MIIHKTTTAIIEKDGKFLLVQRANKPNKNYWATPGGHVDKGESVYQAMLRELKEEVGEVKINRKPIFDFVHDVRIGHKHHCHVFIGKPIKVRAGGDAKKLSFFTLNQMKKMNLTHYTIKIFNKLYGKRL